MKDCISKYIGIPYVRNGVSFDGCDCWGLIRLFYGRELDIALPDYTAFPCRYDLFSRTSMPTPYNIALIAHDGEHLDHCALLTAAGLLHSLESAGSVLSRPDLWESKIKGWYVFGGSAA